MVALKRSVLFGFGEFSKTMNQTFAEANMSIEFRKNVRKLGYSLLDGLDSHTHTWQLTTTDRYNQFQPDIPVERCFSRFCPPMTECRTIPHCWNDGHSLKGAAGTNLTSLEQWAPFPFDVMRRYQLRCKAQGTGTELLEGLGHLGVVHPTVGGLWVGAKMS